ncbi:MAG TPA: radical SAM protein [Spirochaetales bacterium]|nr:radical SAM protein [Spirochaetales bacterium]
MLDSFGRSIDYLRISVTDRCNLRCFYCMPEEGIELLKHEAILSYEAITQVAQKAVKLGFTKIRLTGGEPLIRKNIVDLVAMLSNISGIKTIAMTTNGTLLSDLAQELKNAGLTSINVSLDTMDSTLYSIITRGGSLDAVLKGIYAAKNAGLAIKINTVVLDTALPILAEQNCKQDIEAVRSFADSIGAQFQRIAQYNLAHIKQDYSEIERPPACASCNRLRLLANGVLRPCLHSNIEIPIDFTNIEASIKSAIALKPAHGLSCTGLTVGQIGG